MTESEATMETPPELDEEQVRRRLHQSGATSLHLGRKQIAGNDETNGSVFPAAQDIAQEFINSSS